MPHQERQPDPDPSAPTSAPSLLAYAATILVGVALCWLALLLTSNRRELWAALLLNVGTGLAGTVVVFVAIERRLRAAELRRLGAVIPRWYASLVHPHIDAQLNYARQFLEEVLRIQPVLTRPPADFMALLQRHPRGFCVVGDAGKGKTVAIQQLAIALARVFVADPHRGSLPILLPMRLHIRARLEDNLWYEGMQKYGVQRDTVKHNLQGLGFE